MNNLPPITFTEPTEQELLAVTEGDLLAAALSMIGVNPAYREYVRSTKTGGIKPCLYRMH